MTFYQEKVLVTGASGYIALHCILELLNKGYKVRGSLRNLNREDEVRKSLGIEFKNQNLEFCKLNLLNDDGWDDAASDCDYLLHIASPCFVEEPKDDKELITPALEGTLRALKAAQKSKVRKVVLTSSMGAIAYGHNKRYCDTTDWTDTSVDVGAYIKSKTISEKAAWDYLYNESNNSFDFTTIHPGMVFGPLLNKKRIGSSAGLILNMIRGKYPALPDVFFTVVDVRDVSRLHVDALKNIQSNNKRIIATSEKGISFLKISQILRDLGFEKSPKNLIPNKVINSLAPFNKEMRSTAAMIKRGYYGTDLDETKKIFKWNSVPLEKTLKDMAESLESI